MDSPTDDIVILRAEVALARAKMAEDAATIARQNLEIAKLRRQLYGPRSERTARLLDQIWDHALAVLDVPLIVGVLVQKSADGLTTVHPRPGAPGRIR